MKFTDNDFEIAMTEHNCKQLRRHSICVLFIRNQFVNVHESKCFSQTYLIMFFQQCLYV